jgi:hypothetical protein
LSVRIDNVLHSRRRAKVPCSTRDFPLPGRPRRRLPGLGRVCWHFCRLDCRRRYASWYRIDDIRDAVIGRI